MTISVPAVGNFTEEVPPPTYKPPLYPKPPDHGQVPPPVNVFPVDEEEEG